MTLRPLARSSERRLVESLLVESLLVERLAESVLVERSPGLRRRTPRRQRQERSPQTPWQEGAAVERLLLMDSRPPAVAAPHAMGLAPPRWVRAPVPLAQPQVGARPALLVPAEPGRVQAVVVRAVPERVQEAAGLFHPMSAWAVWLVPPMVLESAALLQEEEEAAAESLVPADEGHCLPAVVAAERERSVRLAPRGPMSSVHHRTRPVQQNGNAAARPHRCPAMTIRA